MHNTFTPIFYAHAISGSVMLISGAVAMAAKKGRSYHRLAGKSYAVATTLVAISGFIIALQKSNQFLIATSIFVMYMMVSAYRSLYLKQLYKVVKARPVDWAIIVVASAASLFLVGMGATALVAGNYGGAVPVVFGILGLRFNIRDIKKFTKGPDDKNHWLYNHISGMIGSYIAGFTAFLAVNAGFFGDSFNVAVWLLPSVVGVPCIVYTIRNYKNKGNKVKELKIEIGSTD